jgi:hypothetical protein
MYAVDGCSVNNTTGCFRWGLTKSGLFSVKSMYIDYMDNHTKYLHKYLWRIKVPLKIRVFMWFLHKIVFLTKDNLIKGNVKVVKSVVVTSQKRKVENTIPFLNYFLSCIISIILSCI